ncbi:hypothetical protein BKA61DRAFT_581557 [Leptodontidium sp. MPI-SDFR-AT-0119]|nr:hypothetical protein BKA61DRAFT_581557 [Leptodontidium sp. MPI-SDFR-AT-0119]
MAKVVWYFIAIMYFKAFTQLLSSESPASVTERSNNSSCGQVYISGFLAPNCNSAEAVIAPIGSTGGNITPLLWDIPDIKSIRYWDGVTNETSCQVSLPRYPTQYRFYGKEGRDVGVAYLTLGQIGRGCVDFNNASVVSYKGVNMLVSLPDGRTGVGQDKDEIEGGHDGGAGKNWLPKANGGRTWSGFPGARFGLSLIDPNLTGFRTIKSLEPEVDVGS